MEDAGTQSYDDPMDSIADRLMALEPEEEQEPESVEAAPEDDEVEGQAEDDSVEESEEPEYIEIKHNGKPVKLKLDEVEEYVSKGYDYTTKTMELAEQRRSVEQYAQTLQRQAEFQRQFQQEYAQLSAMDMQLQQYQNINFDAWMDQDPVEASKGWQRFQMLRQNREDTARQIASRQSEAQLEMERVAQQRLMEADAQLQRELGAEWSADTKKALRQTGESYGFSPEELGGIQDPRVVKVLLDAQKWQALKAKQPEVQKRVSQAPKLAKPGGKAKPNAKAQLRSQLKKDGSMASAAAYLESLL